MLGETNEMAYERELRSKLKQAIAKEDRPIHRLVKLLDDRLGKQSVTIHQLRCQLAEVRELHSKIERDELRRLERDNEVLLEWNHSVVAENRALREKLAGRRTFDIPENTPPEGVPSNEDPNLRIHASDPSKLPPADPFLVDDDAQG